MNLYFILFLYMIWNNNNLKASHITSEAGINAHAAWTVRPWKPWSWIGQSLLLAELLACCCQCAAEWARILLPFQDGQADQHYAAYFHTTRRDSEILLEFNFFPTISSHKKLFFVDHNYFPMRCTQKREKESWPYLIVTTTWSDCR